MEKKKITNLVVLLIISIAIAFSFAGCGQYQNEVKNFIWKASKGANTIYLAGTMHLSPMSYRLVSDKLNSIIDESDGIAVECNLIDKNNMDRVQKESQSKITLGKGNLEDYLSSEEVKKLKDMLSDYGIDYAGVKDFSPYGILTKLESIIYSSANLNSTGLDNALLNIYQKSGKTIYELEGVDFQLDIFDKIYTFDTLKQCLEQYHEGTKKEMIDGYKNLFQLYINGDSKFFDLFNNTQYYMNTGNNYNVLIKDRNINMANKIDQLAKSGKVYLVAVGAGHFTGEDSIISKLEEMGYKVEQQ